MSFLKVIKSSIMGLLNILSLLSLRDKVILFLLLLMTLAIPPLLLFSNAQKEEVSRVRSRLTEFYHLEQEYLALKAQTEDFEKRGGLVRPKGVIEETHNLFDSFGLKKNIKSTKGLGSRERQDGYLEESIEIIAEGLTLNELINLFYRLDRVPMMLSVRSFSINRSFDKPDHVHLQLHLSLFVKK
jgi:hypothetical protein